MQHTTLGGHQGPVPWQRSLSSLQTLFMDREEEGLEKEEVTVGRGRR
jgi:hypothetical protein